MKRFILFLACFLTVTCGFAQEAAQDLGSVRIQKLQFNDATELTISTGAITATQAYHSIDTEADAAIDDLDTITVTGFPAGSIFTFVQANSARDVIFKNGTGNLITGSTDYVLSSDQAVCFIYDGANLRLYNEDIRKQITTIAPTVNDDSTQGYGIFSEWIDTVTGVFYKCIDNTATAAIWITSLIGPSSAVDNTIPRYDGTTGSLLQGSGISIDDSDNITVPGDITTNNNKVFVYPTTDKWIIFGDSISDSLTLDYPVEVISLVGFTGTETHAVAGDRAFEQLDALDALLLGDPNYLDDFNILSLLVGANDILAAQDIGTRSDSASGSTLASYYKDFIETALTANPKIKIYLMTQFETDSVAVPYGFANATYGWTFKDLSVLISQICSDYSINCIDLYSISNFNEQTISTFTVAGVHPNADGIAVLGPIIANAFTTKTTKGKSIDTSIPCAFDDKVDVAGHLNINNPNQKTWHVDTSVFGFGGNGSVVALDLGGLSYTYFGNNWYYDGASKAIETGPVGLLAIFSTGALTYSNAGSTTADATASLIERFRVELDGTITAGDTVNYETLVTSDDDIPNKKHLDNEIISKTSSNIVYVDELSDLPAPTDTADGLGTRYRLEDNTDYYLSAELTWTYGIVPSDTSNQLTGGFSLIQTWDGTGAFIANNATTPCGAFSMDTLQITGDGTNTLFAVDTGGALAADSCIFDGMLMGTVSNLSLFALRKVEVNNQKSVLEIDTVTKIEVNGAIFNPAGAISDALVEVKGPSTSVSFLDALFIPYSGDAALNIDSAFVGYISIAHSFLLDAAGGIPFKSGSLDQTDPQVHVLAVSGIPNSQLIAGMYMRGNTTEVEIVTQGVDGVFQSAEDAGGGQLQLNTTDTTGFANGDIVWLPNTIYAGKYTISNLVANTSFEVTKAFTATATGAYQKGWIKVAGTTTEGFSEESSMTASNEITFENIESNTLRVICDYSVNGVTASDTINTCVMKDDDILSDSIKSRDVTTTEGEGMSHGVDSFILGDTLSFYVRNMTSASRNILFSAIHVSSK